MAPKRLEEAAADLFSMGTMKKRWPDIGQAKGNKRTKDSGNLGLT